MYLKINSIKKLESRFSFSLNSNTKFIQSLKNRDNSFEKVAIKKSGLNFNELRISIYADRICSVHNRDQTAWRDF